MDYFKNLEEYIRSKKWIYTKKEEYFQEKVESLKGIALNDEVKEVYEKYSTYIIAWKDASGKNIGYINFISSTRFEFEHKELVEMMEDIYDFDEDEESIAEDIISWYPVVKFLNGDMFCLDERDGKIKFFEHDVVDSGVNLHGMTIADSINDLFYKWSIIHFADVYYWEKCCDDHGIDLTSEYVNQFK